MPQRHAVPPPLAPPAPAADEESLVGRKLGSYEVTRFIGRGGLGAVYEAMQEGLNRPVALKVLPPGAAEDAVFLEAFRREAQAAAKLNHPNIVKIFDIVEDQGLHFFAMEYVDGESLADRIEREGPLRAPDALQIIARAATALDHANEHMLIHRNLKPANILLTSRGDVKVADLGLSKSLEQSAVGIVEGTHGGPIYMAPELAASPQLADCRSDIYSLGCVLFHAVAGRPPFPGPSAPQLIEQHAKAHFPSARTYVSRLPMAIDVLLKKMCAKDPASRFQTHAELGEHLDALLQATAVRAPEAHKAPQPSRRKWLLIGGGIAAAAAIAAIVILVLARGGSKPEQARKPTPPPTPRPRVAPSRPRLPEDEPPEFAAETVPGTEYQPPTPSPKAPAPPKPPQKAPPPDWRAKLADVRRRATADARAGRFAKAIGDLAALTQGSENAELRTAVAAAAAALRRQAAAACRAALRNAKALVAKGRHAQARAALQSVVDNFGTPKEIGLARAALASVAQHEHLGQAATQAARDAADAGQATQRRQEARARLAKALEPIEEQLKSWRLAEAAAALGALKFDDKAVAAQVAQRKAAVDALIALRTRMIQRIKTAKPPLDKRSLHITGLNGQLVGADENEIRASITFGAKPRIEKIPWAKLRPKSAEALAEKAAEKNSAADALATALFLQLLGDEEKAKSHLDRAEALGAELAAAGEPAAAGPAEVEAARAFAGALGHYATGRLEQARQALADYQKEFAKTEHFAAHKKTLDVAKAYSPIVVPGAAALPKPPVTPKPKAKPKAKPKGKPKAKPKAKPKPKAPVSPAALALYQKAVRAFQQRHYDAAGSHLADLKAKFPKTRLLSDTRRKPSVPAMLRVLAAQGPRIVVSHTADGAARTLAAAISSIDKPNARILIEPGTYAGGITLVGERYNGLAFSGTGDRPARLNGGTSRRVILRFPADLKNIVVERIEFTNTDIAIFLGARCSATLRNVVALQDVGAGLDKFPTSPVTIAASLLTVSGLPSATARGSAFLCDETPIDYGNFVGCLIVGPDLSLDRMALTDCLILGPVTLLGGNRFNHVTVIGPITIPKDSIGNSITNSILESIETWKPDRKVKEKPHVALTIKSTVLRRGDALFHKDLVKADRTVRAARVAFAGAKSGDFRLAADSPLRGRAADKTDLGCRFPPELLELLKRARRYPALLRLPSRRR